MRLRDRHYTSYTSQYQRDMCSREGHEPCFDVPLLRDRPSKCVAARDVQNNVLTTKELKQRVPDYSVLHYSNVFLHKYAYKKREEK